MAVETIPLLEPTAALAGIAQLDAELARRFSSKLKVDASLTRSLVSFQANKALPIYRWYKYKEGFSAYLIELFFQRYGLASGPLLDPFAGSGTALFVAKSQGIESHGIELLPIGQQIIATKELIDNAFDAQDLKRLKQWASEKPWLHEQARRPFTELRITKGAYSPSTADAIQRYLGALAHESPHVQQVLRFALLCVLESISYTRKDGQYLRWDHRSGRRTGKKLFDKGRIPTFDEAITAKLREITHDLGPQIQPSLLDSGGGQAPITLFAGSCLDILPALDAASYSAVVTSPPYCNRYDYTRTYALELAMLGVGERQIVDLRQAMLSCTVENRSKALAAKTPHWRQAIAAADDTSLLQAVLSYLDQERARGALNNDGIARMVRGYFYEMACVIQECARVMRSGAPLIMVNDNVRYAGASISVDLILSAIAESLGFHVEAIHILPNGKGNSSQQMGEHGRAELRKCVYVWRKL